MAGEVLGRVLNAANLLVFECPGCHCGHALDTNRWGWNGDMVKPTASPSLLINAAGAPEVPRCHFFMCDGNLQFLSDCTHDLAGQTVRMAPY